MNKVAVLIPILFSLSMQAEKPCSNPVYRRFDFWIGEWEAFGVNGKKAGDSKISVILDSCIILEEWTSSNITQGIVMPAKVLIPITIQPNNGNRPGLIMPEAQQNS